MLYDVIIIGGGVSGLSAAYALIQKGQRVLDVDRGRHIYERQRTDMFDVANGIGGAGLFSDGKLHSLNVCKRILVTKVEVINYVLPCAQQRGE